MSRANGVGPKLAGRIVSELKDKVGAAILAPAESGVALAGGSGGPAAEAISALVHLGYNPSDAMAAVTHGAGKLGDDAPFEDLIRAGLTELGTREQRA